jgi:hypothetical protein
MFSSLSANRSGSASTEASIDRYCNTRSWSSQTTSGISFEKSMIRAKIAACCRSPGRVAFTVSPTANDHK